MALVNFKRKFLFLMEPHAASRAITTALKEYVPGTCEIGHHHISYAELLEPRRQHLDPNQAAELTVYCNIRNPFDRLITQWLHRGANRERTLSEYVRDLWDTPFMGPSRGLHNSATKFVYYEYLEVDLQLAFNCLKLKLEYDPQHITAGKSKWQSYYNREIMDKLRFRPDWQSYLTKFGYW